MAIKPICDACKTELVDSGAMLLDPPDTNSIAKKYHLRKDCYQKALKLLKVEETTRS